MKLVLQRVKQASVRVDGDVVSSIGPGLLVLVGFGAQDELSLPESKTWTALLKKILELRIFPDDSGKLNKSLTQYGEHGGGVLLVSQFTLYADCRKGRRPSFQPASPPDTARTLYGRMKEDLAAMLPGRVEGGVFGAEMDVSLVNWGPVTILLDSEMFNHTP